MTPDNYKLTIEEIALLRILLKFSKDKDVMGNRVLKEYSTKVFSGVRWFFKNTEELYEGYQAFLAEKTKELTEKAGDPISAQDIDVKLNNDKELIAAYGETLHDVSIPENSMEALMEAYAGQTFGVEDSKAYDIAEKLGIKFE